MLTPGSVVEGKGTGNSLEVSGDITGDTISGIQTLITGNAFDHAVGAAGPDNITLTNAQWNGFSAIASDGMQVSAFTIDAATAGTYNLAAKDSADSFNMTALSNGGTTLIGNNAAAETLTASATGNDTLQAGNGNNDTLVAGSGNDTLIGGAGTGTKFVISHSSLAGDVVTFNGVQEQIVFPDPATVIIQAGEQATITGSDGVMTVTNNLAGLTRNVIDWNAGGSEIQTFTTPASGGIQEQDTGCAGTNGSGAVAYQQTTTTVAGETNSTISGKGDTSGLSSASITLGKASSATLVGSEDAVSVGSNDTLALSNNAFDGVTITGTGSKVTDAGHNGETLTMSGQASSDLLTISAADSSVQDNGASDTSTLQGNYESATMYGGHDTVTISGANGNAADRGTGGNTITLSGAGDSALLFTSGDTSSATGSHDSVGDIGTGNNAITVSGTTDTAFLSASHDTLKVTGEGDAAYDLNGSNTISLTGSSDTCYIYSAAADTLTVGGSSNSIDVEASVTGAATDTISGKSALLEFGGATTDEVLFGSGATGKLLLNSASSFAGTVAGLASGDSIDLANFLFSGAPTVSKVTGSGAVNTDTDVTVTDGSQHLVLALLNQYANQFAVSASAYTLTADSTASSAGTLFQLAAGR